MARPTRVPKRAIPKKDPPMELNSSHTLAFKTAYNKKDIVTMGAERFQVSADQFGNWRWQMKHQISTSQQLQTVLDPHPDETEGFEKLSHKFQAGITPYYAMLMDPKNPSCPIRIQANPVIQELYDPIGVADPLNETSNSPVKEMVHVYEDRVAFCIAQLCSVYCRYCFRKRRDEEVGLHFNPKVIQEGVDYIQSHPKIRDVLLTGGDPLVAHDSQILKVVEEIRSIPHVEIIRIGTRVPVTLPYRITPELAKGLAQFHPIWINTHFNHPLEVTPDAANSIDILLREGIPVGNQSVLLKGVNDDFNTLKALNEALVRIRVRPYYLYQAQIVEGTEHLRVPIEKGIELVKHLRGRTSGYAIPQYVLDTPTGKIPLNPQFIKSRKNDFLELEDLWGNSWEEHNPL